jgi:hypothetical protein
MYCRLKYATEKNDQPTGIKLTNRRPLPNPATVQNKTGH